MVPEAGLRRGGAQPSKYGSNRWTEDRSYKKDRWGGRRLDSERDFPPCPMSPRLTAFPVFSALGQRRRGSQAQQEWGIALGSLLTARGDILPRGWRLQLCKDPTRPHHAGGEEKMVSHFPRCAAARLYFRIFPLGPISHQAWTEGWECLEYQGARVL